MNLCTFAAFRTLVAASAIGVVTLPGSLSASDSASSESKASLVAAASSASVIEASDNAIAPYSSITIAKPVGRVRLARPGDELGERRFEVRSASSGAAIVSFSRNQSLKGAGGIQASGFPTGLPLQNARLTSAFGYRLHPLSGRYQSHAGVDLAAAMGTPVTATADGVVGLAGWMGGYGLMIQLGHAENIETRYAHLSSTAVTAGQVVRRGQIIGYVGSTGRSTGPHLHYEVRVSEVAIDPLS